MLNLSRVSNRSILGSALRLPLRLIPKKAVVRVLQGPARGKRWIAGASTHGCWLGSYEGEKQAAFTRHLRPGSVVYDVGANVGFYTLLGSVVIGNEGSVYAFEPVPRNLEYLREHVRMNGLANVRVFDAAMGEAEGRVRFSLASNPSMGHVGGGDGEEIEVRMETLDGLVAREGLGAPDLIKCDIEGAEAGFLKGARETLRAHRPAILLATHGRAVHADCCGILRDLGYRVEALDGGSVEETDELLARAE